MSIHALRGAPLAALVLLLAAGTVRGQARGFQPTDYYQVRTVGQVAVSPAGDLVAFTVTSVVESENRRQRRIWLQRLEDGRPAGEPFPATVPTEDSTDPTFSPDGGLLSFQSSRGDDPNATWFLRLDAPGGEAFHLPGVEGRPQWSPDGSKIAYLSRDTADTGDAPAPRRLAPDAVTHTLDPERFDGYVLTSMRYRRDGRQGLQPHPSVRGNNQLHVVGARGGEPMAVTRVDFDVQDVTWSADGLHLFFAGDPGQDDETASGPRGDLWVVAAAGGGVRRLAEREGGEEAPSVSPDGARLAFLATPARGAETDVWVADLDSRGELAGEPVNLTEDWSLEPGSPRWSPDGLRLWWTARSGGDVHVFSMPASGGAVEQVTDGERQLRGASFSRDHGIMAYAATDVTTPLELFVARGDGSDEVKATRLNDEWMAGVELNGVERLTWTVEDGTTVEGWVMKPVGFDPAERYPMILKIHGGPHSAYGNTFFPTFHVLSAAGFFVLYTNPRGSSGYGNDFEYATREAWGILDSEDYLGGVDAAQARYPEVESGRIGVSGGSYGGFMSNWLTATTDRFAASVTSRSISNWESWWGTSDVPSLTEFEFGGTPWERRDLYRRLSPISYVENVTAPTLIIHSEEDYRTPVGDAEQWFLALKKRQVPTELVRYPRSSHGLSRTGEPWLLVDRLERIRSWFVHFLVEEPAVTAAR